MPFPINTAHRLALEDGTSLLLLEDNSSKVILDEAIALDDPLNAATVATLTPGLTFTGEQLISPPIIVQRKAGSDLSGGTGSITVPFNGINVGGNTIIAILTGTDSSSALWTSELHAVTDSQGNSYTQDFSQWDATSHNGIKVFHANGIKGGANSVLESNDTNNPCSLFVYEVYGLDTSSPFNQSVFTPFSTGTNYTSGNVTVNEFNELLLGVSVNASTATFTSGSNYSNIQNQSGVSSANAAVHEQIVADPGTFNSPMTASASVSGVAALFTFKAAPPKLTYELQVDTVNTFNSQVSATTLGAVATDRATTFNAATTALNNNNPLVSDGTIGTVEIWCNTNITGAKVGTFFGSGTSWTMRDFASIGTITAGSKQTFSGLSIAAAANDIIGVFGSAGFHEADNSGGAVLTKSGDNFISGAQTYFNNTPWTISVIGYLGTPLLDKTSDLNIGFVDDTTTALGDDDLLLEDGTSDLLLEDNTSFLKINYSYPSSDYMTYTVPGSTLSNSTTYYWRARQKIQNGGVYGAWSEIRSFTISISAGGTALGATLMLMGVG